MLLKKHGKILWVIVIAILILSVFPLLPVQGKAGEGEIAFTMTLNAAFSLYSFTDVDVGPTSAGYSAVNMSYPTELQLIYNGVALSPSNRPVGWTVTTSSGAGDTTNVSILIASPAIYGKAANIEGFLAASAFTLKTTGVYPPTGSGVTIMVSEQTIIQFTDIYGTTHAYEFVEFAQQADRRTLSWLEAYNAARHRSIGGKQGYLATLASIEEQMFVYDSIAQKPGWLGGTRLRNNSAGNLMIDNRADISTNINDYTSNRDIAVSWYWADGPEA